MAIKSEDFATIGLPVAETDATTVLTVNSAFDWLKEHTTLEFDIDNLETLSALPSTAKLFVVKYVDVMAMGTGVTSESLGGMSQSFDTALAGLIWQYARELLSSYLKSDVSVVPAKRKW